MRPVLLACLLLPLLALAADAPFPQPPYSWRGIEGSGVFPARDLVTEFWDIAPDVVTTVKDAKKGELKLTLPGAPGSRKNIVWRTTLPHWGQNAPVVVKDRVFVLCDEGWKDDAPVLVCLDVKDGTLLWKQPVDHLDAWPEDKAKIGKEIRAREHARWRLGMVWWNKLYWNNETNGWANLTAEQAAPIIAEAKEAGVTLKPAYVTGPDGKQVVQRPGGVSGGPRGRYGLGGNVIVDGQNDVYNTCNRERYYWYPGWSSEGPYFGTTMGSVVSDGTRVYAVTALDGAACYDLEGKRLWVTDLVGQHIRGYPASAPGIIQNHMASPVLADGKLIYYHKDAVEFIALDTRTGRLAWRTPGPLKAGTKPQFYQVAGTPIGYEGGHMTPGGTPVVMRLGDTTVVVSGHGMVCRVADGKFLGQVGIPADLARKGGGVAPVDDEPPATAPAAGMAYGGSYTSWVARGDMLYAVLYGKLVAVQVGLQGETLTQKVRWSVDGVDGRNPNPVVAGDLIYCLTSAAKRQAVTALDAATGAVRARGPATGGYATNLAVGATRAVWMSNDLAGKVQDNGFMGNPKTSLGKGMELYAVVALPSLNVLGTGYLCPEEPAGEVRDRHIARLGSARVAWGHAGVTCWGNRIFIRNNDYLWCIGDPAQPFVPSEPHAADPLAEQAPRDPSARIAAAQALMAVPTPPVETVPALIAALGDDYHVVRHAAAEALGRIGAPAALARALGVTDFYTRWGAARALRVTGPAAEAALPALHTALRDGAFDVRLEATHALARLGPSEAKGRALATACEDHEYLVRRTAMEALAHDSVSAAVVVPALLAALGDGDGQVRSLAASALAGVGEAAVPEIARQLASGDSAQVRTGVTALGLVGREAAAAAGTTAVPTLIRMLTGDDRATAARALAAIGPAAAAATPELLKAMLRDVEATRAAVTPIQDGYIKDRTTRYAIRDSEATRAVAAMGAAAVTPLLELLRGDDTLTRRFAMDALGRVGPAAGTAVPEMVAYLRAETDTGRRANLMLTIAAVGDGAGEAVPVLVGYLGGTGADDVSGRYAAQALAQIGAKAVPALIAALRHPDALVRQRAASALSSMAPNVAGAAREALRAAARDADPAVVAAAGEALKHLEGDASRPAEEAPEP